MPGSGPKKKFFYVIGGDRYRTVKEAATSKGVSIGSISEWCNGGREDCHKETLGGKRVPTTKKKAKKASSKTQKEKHAKVSQPKKAPKTKAAILDAVVAEMVADGINPSTLIKDSSDTPPPAESPVLTMTPLEYMLKIMCDPKEEPDRRDKMANWAAPYVHPRGSEKKGKKEEQEDRAKSAAKGRFSAGKPPLSLVKGTK